MAWDSDIDTLDPAVFKSQGGYVTVANIMRRADHVEGAAASSGKPGLFRSLPARVGGHLAESWTHGGQRGHHRAQDPPRHEVPERPAQSTPTPSSTRSTAALLSPGYMKLIFPTLIQVSAPEQFVVRDDYTFAINMKAASPMGLDTVALSNNAILDPELVKAQRDQGGPVGDGVAQAQHRVDRALHARQERARRRDRDGGHAELLAPASRTSSASC